MIHKFESIILILVPLAFWVSVAWGIVISIFTSSPHFLGSKKAASAFTVVAALFLVNLSHTLVGWPFLFGTPLAEYPMIAVVMAVLSVWRHRSQEAKLESLLSNDPSVTKCPKCGSYVEKIMAECPKCETRL